MKLRLSWTPAFIMATTAEDPVPRTGLTAQLLDLSFGSKISILEYIVQLRTLQNGTRRSAVAMGIRNIKLARGTRRPEARVFEVIALLSLLTGSHSCFRSVQDVRLPGCFDGTGHGGSCGSSRTLPSG
jgi:hypothetical protein